MFGLYLREKSRDIGGTLRLETYWVGGGGGGGGVLTVPQELYNRPLNDSNGTIMLIIYQWIPTQSTPDIARFRPHEKSQKDREISSVCYI